MTAMVAECIDGPRREEILSLLCGLSSLFHLDDRPLAVARNVYHIINTGDAHPLRQRSYRVLPSKSNPILNEVEPAEGIIGSSSSPGIFPPSWLRKKIDPCAFVKTTAT